MKGDPSPESAPTRLRILSLEDDSRDAELIQTVIQKAGLAFEFHRVTTEAAFVAALDAGGFDVVLSDYSLPGTDGGVALQLCRERRPEWPFVFVTGSLGEEVAIETLKQGAADYVLKDNLVRLPRAVERAIREAKERTARRAAEQALRASEERMRLFFERQVVGMAITSPEKGWLQVNDRLCEMLGYSREELAGTTWAELTHPEDLAADVVQFNRLLAWDINDYALEKRFVRKDGRLVHTNLAVACVRRPDGSVDYVLTLLQDITDRKQAERALAEQKRLLQTLVSHLPVAVYLKDPAGRRILTNPVDMDNLGVRSEAEVLGKTDFDFFPPEEAARTHAAEQQVLASGQPLLNQEDKLVRPDGSVRWLLNSKVPLFDEAGRAIGLTGIGFDITERHRLQSQLIQAQKMEAVGQLAGGVAHDFNNILTAVLMQLSLLQSEEGLSAEVRAGLAELETEANRAAGLTRQLLMFSRRQVLQRQVLDLNSLLGNFLKMLRRLIGEHIGLEFNGAPCDLWIEADPGMLEQVVMNLVVNARDAMPNGGRITLATCTAEFDERAQDRHPEAVPGPFVCLTVTDTGCGMDAAALKHVFEPFFTTKEAGKGTGLGLATVYGIVKQHGGWVEIETAVGQGSTFSVYLPAKAQVSAIRGDEGAVAAVKGGSEAVLLVEDEASVRQKIVALLRLHGYRVFGAGNAPEAFELWQQHDGKVDLLITDMVMPGGMSGLELAEQLLTHNARLKVILMSGYSSDLARRDAPKRDFLTFLQKPFVASTLAKLVRDCLDAK